MYILQIFKEFSRTLIQSCH